MTAPGGTEADRAARERLAREARVTATALLDWVGTRVDGVATAGTTRPGGTARPRQSPGPCGWCPVCALVAAVRGEQPELTAHLAEQASGLLVVLRLLLQSHVHEHPPHEHPPHEHPVPSDAVPPDAATGAATPPPPSATDPEPDGAADDPADLLANPDVPWDAPHAVFDPDPVPAAPVPDGASRSAPERPTGKRGPRPSPRPRPLPLDTPAPAAPATAGPRPQATTPGPAPATPVPARTPTAPAPARSDRGVQRIPVRRRPRPC